MRLEDLTPNTAIRGILPNATVTVVSIQWHGTEALTLVYRDPSGRVANELLFRHDEARVEIADSGRPFAFDGDGALFRLVSEAHRIRLAHLFDPVLAVHTSLVQPIPHQITAVYESMLPKQPLRFLLADDPGAGKTIMAGLLMKELIARGDLKRCLVVCPGTLVDQWQEDLTKKFHLPFEILTNDKLGAARTGNWFQENDLVIARLDKLARNDEVQDLLRAPDVRFDLVVCDEAHKMSASFFGGEIKHTKRYKLGQLLSTLTRHFLLMTATPHNGKEEDFQLFLALLDGDRFEGRFRDGAHKVDVSDLMRRMVKENLLKFDGSPLFPKRFAYTVPYQLSEAEDKLYQRVTHYVRTEFSRAGNLQNDKRTGTVGFALTVLQRRLASSPEAIYQSLKRRHERLEKRLRELLERQYQAPVSPGMVGGDVLDNEEVEDLDEAPENEVEEAEEEVLDQATAASTIAELEDEIATLKELEALAEQVRNQVDDAKWRELAELLSELFNPHAEINAANFRILQQSAAQTGEPVESLITFQRRKMVIFTEHRDTLNYLLRRISKRIGNGNSSAVVTIHGALSREERRKAETSFLEDPQVQILIATDAAGEGINLQRAHLMVNYDLPWNPNRLEQRFGRIHRIGQTKPCHLWNLVADGTREGDVYRTLLEKLEEARKALGGQVFDVLGKLQFEGRPLRDLLIEAICAEKQDAATRLNQTIAKAVDRSHLESLLEDHALAHDTMDKSRVARVREEMERAEARRLQPHYIESFFLEAFKHLEGSVRRREGRRYEVTNVPAAIRNRATSKREVLSPRIARIVFEKDQVDMEGYPQATFICPGHALLDATLFTMLERHGDLLKQGTVLVDERDAGTQPRALFYLEHALQDASLLASGERRTISKRMLYVELSKSGAAQRMQYAPYLDFRPLVPGEPSAHDILARPECDWMKGSLEQQAIGYAIGHMVPEHLSEVKGARLQRVAKTKEAVHQRLQAEIRYWDQRASVLKEEERAGKPNARLNSNEARKRADDLQMRLEKRLADLDREAQVSAQPPVVMGGLLVVPVGLITAMTGKDLPESLQSADTQAAAARARAVVMEVERALGFEPRDREFEKLGYDIESRVPGTGKLRFIEVKGRVSGAVTLTVTKNEILTALNKPEDYVLAMVEFISPTEHRVRYLRKPFQREPDFSETTRNYMFQELLARSEEPS